MFPTAEKPTGARIKEHIDRVTGKEISDTGWYLHALSNPSDKLREQRDIEEAMSQKHPKREP